MHLHILYIITVLHPSKTTFVQGGSFAVWEDDEVTLSRKSEIWDFADDCNLELETWNAGVIFQSAADSAINVQNEISNLDQALI